MAATGTLIARGAFQGRLDALAVVSALALAAVAGLTWHRGRVIYRRRLGNGPRVHPEAEAFRLLTLATVSIAALATVVTLLT